MHCPYCKKKEIKVIDSRESAEDNAIRRRRECLSCLRRFTTFETIELSVQVEKRNGLFEEFQQSKMLKGLEAACNHTAINHEAVISLASKITDEILRRRTPKITTREIGDLIMQHLKKLDLIAYIRFACVYRRFKEIGELMEALEAIHPDDVDLIKENFLCH